MNVIEVKSIKMEKWKKEKEKRIGFQTSISLNDKGLLLNRWWKIVWNGLIMGRGKWLMHYWKQLKSNGQNEGRERHKIKSSEIKKKKVSMKEVIEVWIWLEYDIRK